MSEATLAWHWLRNDKTLGYGDGRIVEEGKTLSIPKDTELELCHGGMHASECVLDALAYAPGNIICRVELSGEVIRSADKLVAEHRTVLWMVDAEETLRHYARWCAKRVVHLWDCPAIVLQYLDTGDEKIRWSAARSAADVGYAAAARYAADGSAAGYAAADAAGYAAAAAARSADAAAGYAAADAAGYAAAAARSAAAAARYAAARYAAARYAAARYAAARYAADAAAAAAADGSAAAHKRHLNSLILALAPEGYSEGTKEK